MFKKKCPACSKKIEKKFNFCPWCGHSFKKQRLEEDFGMLGQNDEIEQQISNQLNLPFGMNGIFNGLMKQIEKELANMDNLQPSNGLPRGFKINISTGQPGQQPKIVPMKQPKKKQPTTIQVEEADENEKERRAKLKRVDAKSTIRRLPEGLVYEIDAPGVRTVKDVVITKLEESMEVKVYAEEKCYVKSLPLKMDVVEFSVQPNKVLLKLQN
ncbi:Uncharacterised protein [uncultured archaeon]|nr:Uncharacterised protein [uncultured archaeon]